MVPMPYGGGSFGFSQVIVGKRLGSLNTAGSLSFLCYTFVMWKRFKTWCCKSGIHYTEMGLIVSPPAVNNALTPSCEFATCEWCNKRLVIDTEPEFN